MQKQGPNKSNIHNPLNIMFGGGDWPKGTPDWVRDIPGLVVCLLLAIVCIAAFIL